MTIAVTAVPPVSSLARSLTEPRGFGDQTLITPRPDSIRLLGGIPAPEALPVPDIARVSAELWSDRAAATAALQYSSATGFEGCAPGSPGGRASTRPGSSSPTAACTGCRWPC